MYKIHDAPMVTCNFNPVRILIQADFISYTFKVDINREYIYEGHGKICDRKEETNG
jgi:hypothetical protein